MDLVFGEFIESIPRPHPSSEIIDFRLFAFHGSPIPDRRLSASIRDLFRLCFFSFIPQPFLSVGSLPASSLWVLLAVVVALI